MKPFAALALFSISLTWVSAEPRTWRDASGSRNFKAEYVSHDDKSVTVKRLDGSEQTFATSILHADDVAWLKKLNETPEYTSGTAFDTLSFGDSRETVEAKLAASKFVTSKVEKAFRGRTGLNGVYQTTKTIGDLSCFLYFDWDSNGTLKEVTLRSELADRSLYDTNIKSTWSEMVDLVTMLHGKPLQAAPYPSEHQLENGAFLGSHLWRTEEGNCALLGTGQENDKYNVVLRITTERIDPAPTH